MLVALTIKDYPNMKDDKRKKLFRSLRKKANKFSGGQEKKVLSDDLPELLKGLMNGR